MLVGFRHDGGKFDGGELMVAQVPRHAFPVEHADIVPPTGFHDKGTVEAEEFPAMISTDVEAVAQDEELAGLDLVEGGAGRLLRAQQENIHHIHHSRASLHRPNTALLSA